MQITSFGCGPDAFFLDEIATFLARHGKALTLIKVDDVNNVGSLNLLSLDFDSNVSEVNVVNRLLLFVEDLE